MGLLRVGMQRKMWLERWPVIAVNAVLLALWAWLFRPVYPYLGTIFTRQEFRTNQIVLLAVLALIVIEARRGRFRFSLLELPQLHLPGLTFLLFGAAGFIAAERWLDINTLSATLYGMATYGLLGLWMPPQRWRQGLPAALLLVGVLPFGEHLNTFIGYPIRLVTARLTGQGLAALGVPNIGVDTILVFENGLSQVDNPCSGVKSLWTGGLFLLAATWIERRPVNWRWLLRAAVFVFFLLFANLARVMLLVLAGQVAGLPLLAEMLHVPLGVIGFAGTCAAALFMLRQLGEAGDEAAEGTAWALARPRWLAPALAAMLIGLALAYTPRLQPVAAAAFDWRLPPGFNAEPWPLSQKELDWLTAEGGLTISAARWRFEWQGLSGSLLLVGSDTWRAHHRPERCFTVYGLEVQESRAHLSGANFPVRWLSLGKSQITPTLYSASYWLQSSEQVTDDYSVRIWDDLSPQPQPWVLVTILFDGPVDPAGAEAQELFSTLRLAVQHSLDG